MKVKKFKRYIPVWTHLFFMGLLAFLLVACNVGTAEQEPANAGENEKMENSATTANNDESVHETVVFDRENTVRVIQEALNRSTTEAEFIVDTMKSVGVHGAIRAELLESLEERHPRLEVESEDNRTYHIHLRYWHTSGFEDNRWYIVDQIFDVGAELWVYRGEECGMGEVVSELDALFEEVVFDHENTVRVIQEALNIDDREARGPLARMASLNIRGAIHALEVEDTNAMEGDRVIDIVTEDNRHYRLMLNHLYVIRTVINLETNETIFPRPR